MKAPPQAWLRATWQWPWQMTPPHLRTSGAGGEEGGEWVGEVFTQGRGSLLSQLLRQACQVVAPVLFLVMCPASSALRSRRNRKWDGREPKHAGLSPDSIWELCHLELTLQNLSFLRI